MFDANKMPTLNEVVHAFDLLRKQVQQFDEKHRM